MKDMKGCKKPSAAIVDKKRNRFLLVAGFPDSLLNFRGKLIEELLCRGFDVHVAAPGLPAGHATRLRLEERGLIVHDIRLQRVGINPFADLIALFDLCKVIFRVRPEMMLSYTIKPVIYGSLAGFLLGVPRRFALITGVGYVFQDQSSNSLKQKFLRSVARRLYGFSLSKAVKVFFQNPDDLALFRYLRVISAKASVCIVNGSGVDVDCFSVVPLPPGYRFLLIARLLNDKGVREYVEAARRVRMRHPEAVFFLVGWIDGNPSAIKQSELDSWKAEGVVKYLGKLEDVRLAIAECSVYVLPSYREGTPRTVLEAMAMGRAIITTDAPGCRETVIDGENGFLVPVKAVDELTSAMLRFVDAPELLTRMGTRSRQIVEEKYDVHRVNAVMLNEMGIQ